jgi:N-acetyl-anhydromuramyl-L-alanine amidase AmpD
MKFKVREDTRFLNIYKENTEGLTTQELFIVARRAGSFSVDYHYLIQRDGNVEEGREPSVVAGFTYDSTRQAIVILVDASEANKLTDAQKVSLRDLKESISATYPDIKISSVRR